MKKIICLILSVMLIVVMLCACDISDSNGNGDGKKVSVITTIFPSYDFARQVGGENVDLTMLIKPGMESHNYDPTPQDIIKIQECDLFIYTGGESDEWVKDILESGDEQPKKTLALMDCVDTVQEDTVEGMTAQQEEGDEIEYDEHVWTSPKNALTISKKISEALIELDPENENTYKKNTNNYAKELSVLDNEFAEVVDNGKRRLLIFGDRFPFRYFADEFGLSYFAAFPGCSSETEPSAATVSFLIDKVQEKKIPVVFTIEFSNGKVADTICEATGVKKLEMHSCHNVTQEDFNKGITYVSLMRENLGNLREALA